MNRLQASHRRTATTSTIAYDAGFGVDGQKHSSLKEIEQRSNNSLGEQPGRRVPVLDICINRVNLLPTEIRQPPRLRTKNPSLQRLSENKGVSDVGRTLRHRDHEKNSVTHL